MNQTVELERIASRPALNPPGRVRSLDGLRGIAALVVVMSHVAIVSPSLSQTASGAPGTVSGFALRILAYSPLRLLWAGPEAVVVFFVLSGYVLALPFATSLDRSWAGYYGKRLVRLYLPVWGALVFAVTLTLIVRPHAIFSGNAVLNIFTAHGNGSDLGHDALLLFGRPGAWNAVLWSLKWEVIFSLLLPLFVVFGRMARTKPFVGAFVLLVVMISQIETDLAFRYLPMFGAGTLLAMTADKWRPRIRAIAAASRAFRWSVVVVCVGLLDLTWLLIGTNKPRWINFAITRNGIVAANVAVTIGAVLLIVIALTFRGTARVLESRLLGWLGSRSYSLYLVHFPIVVCTAFVFKGWSWTGMFTSLALSLLATELFFRAVERPSIRLASAAGRSVRLAVEADRIPTSQSHVPMSSTRM